MKHIKTIFYIIPFLFFLGLTGCESSDDEMAAPVLEAGFTQTINAVNGQVTFINTSTAAVSYDWDFGDGTSSTLISPIKTYDMGGTYQVVLMVIDASGNTSSFQDDVIIPEIFDGGLIVNGDFEDGDTAWIQGVDDTNPAPVITVNDNTYYQVNVTNPNPSQPFLVNLSQKLEIVNGTTYVLTFDAWSDVNRTLIAGIGLSSGTFANDVDTVNLTSTPQPFQIVLTAAGFGATDARVLFDSNGAAGIVNIDNVTLNIQ